MLSLNFGCFYCVWAQQRRPWLGMQYHLTAKWHDVSAVHAV